MNKTVTVNIGGIVFHIDENAYERFKQYLESIRVHFTGSDGRDEIMQDIESRIAEMFQDRIKDQKQVITLVDVEEVTVLMGRPEEFGDNELREKESEISSILLGLQGLAARYNVTLIGMNATKPALKTANADKLYEREFPILLATMVMFQRINEWFS